MPVYSERTMSVFYSTLEDLLGRYLSRTNITITAEEFVTGFILPDDAATLSRACYLTNSYPSTTVYNSLLDAGDAARIPTMLYFAPRPPTLMPTYISSGMVATAPEELRARLVEWATTRRKVMGMFQDAAYALYWLNENCINVNAMNLMFPGMSVLMHDASRPDSARSKGAAKLGQIGRAPTLPRLPQEAKQRYSDAAALINSMALLDNVTPPVAERYGAVVGSSIQLSKPRFTSCYILPGMRRLDAD